MIIDVAVTGVDGQIRYDQKMGAKYGRVAEQNSLRFIPTVFSHTGQTHGEFKILIKDQIKQKLIDFEGEAKSSKVRSVMKWWGGRNAYLWRSPKRPVGMWLLRLLK